MSKQNELARLIFPDGITLGTSAGVSSAANTLSDYEQGTWTPDIEINNSTSGITYATRSASYIKIGKLAFINGDLILSSKGSNTGSVTMSGLPFTVYDRTGGTSLDGGSSLCAFSSGTANVYSPIGVIGRGGYPELSMYISFSSGGNISSNLSHARITNDFSIRFSLTYYTT